MKVKVKYFAVLHEELDRDEEEMGPARGGQLCGLFWTVLRRSGPKSQNTTM